MALVIFSANAFLACPAESFAFNFGYDVVDVTIKAKKESNAEFELPPGFFQDSKYARAPVI
jgi:hypothetical protein